MLRTLRDAASPTVAPFKGGDALEGSATSGGYFLQGSQQGAVACPPFYQSAHANYRRLAGDEETKKVVLDLLRAELAAFFGKRCQQIFIERLKLANDPADLVRRFLRTAERVRFMDGRQESPAAKALTYGRLFGTGDDRPAVMEPGTAAKWFPGIPGTPDLSF